MKIYHGNSPCPRPEGGCCIAVPCPVPGPAGPTGSQGIQGVTGATGPAGPQGIPGPTGPAGPAGGPTGPQGIQGVTGATGPAGPQGIQGVTGATGPTGPQGIQGVTGATGPAGAAGSSDASTLAAYSTGAQSGTANAPLLFDRNALSAGSAISHTEGSGTFTVNQPGLYQASFHASVSPVSTATFPSNVGISLQQDGNALPNAVLLHNFSSTNETIPFSLSVPVSVANAPSTLQVNGSGDGPFLYGPAGFSLTRTGDLPV